MSEVEVVGVNNIRLGVKRLRESMDSAAYRALEQVMETIKAEAKELCPVDTGSLRKSIRREVTARPARFALHSSVRAGGYIINPKSGRIVDYAKYVHEGTSRMMPRPFLARAYDNHKDEVNKLWKMMLKP